MPKFQVLIDELHSALKIIEAPTYDDAMAGNFPGYNEIETEFISTSVEEALDCCKFCERPMEVDENFQPHQDGVVCESCWDGGPHTAS